MDIHTRIADAFASIDNVAEDAQVAFRDRLLVLLNEQGERDESIWNAAGAQLDLTVDMLAQVPVAQRMLSDEWRMGFESVIAASREQAFIEILAQPLFAKMAKHARRTIDAAKGATTDELKQAAKDGVPKAEFDAAKQRRKVRTV